MVEKLITPSKYSKSEINYVETMRWEYYIKFFLNIH